MRRLKFVLPLVLVSGLSACADLPLNRSPAAEDAGIDAGAEAEAESRAGSAAAVRELIASSRRSSARGDYAHAQADIERAIRIEPRNPYLWLELGETHLARDDPRQAIAMARKAVSVSGADDAAKAAAEELLERASRQY